MKGELEYRAVVAVDVDLEGGEVESVTVRAATVDDEMVDVSLSHEGEGAQPDEELDRARQIVDTGAPFELSGRRGAIVYLDECHETLHQLGPGDSYADSAIGRYLPRRYDHYYDGCFARDWVVAVTVVGWNSVSRGRSSCPASQRSSRSGR